MTWNRSLSGFLALLYLAFAFWAGGIGYAFRVLSFLALPMACIWYPDELGSVIGVRFGLSPGLPTVTRTSPGCFVRLLGWALLLLVPVLWIWIMAQG